MLRYRLPGEAIEKIGLVAGLVRAVYTKDRRSTTLENDEPDYFFVSGEI